MSDMFVMISNRELLIYLCSAITVLYEKPTLLPIHQSSKDRLDSKDSAELRKDELSARMDESRFGPIFFGSICGIIGAFTGLAGSGTAGAVLGALPGFANAVHAALRIERVEDIPDRTGLKYLALLDRTLRAR